MTTERTTIDPWPWSTTLGYHQGEVVSGHTRTVYCAGQAATGAVGEPRHEGDTAAQLALALDNLEVVLGVTRLALPSLLVELEATAVS